jgi:hypothetical protein
MNIKSIRLVSLLIVVTISTRFAMVTGARPANFPGFTATTYNSNAVAPGSIFLSDNDPGNKPS